MEGFRSPGEHGPRGAGAVHDGARVRGRDLAREDHQHPPELVLPEPVRTPGLGQPAERRVHLGELRRDRDRARPRARRVLGRDAPGELLLRPAEHRERDAHEGRERGGQDEQRELALERHATASPGSTRCTLPWTRLARSFSSAAARARSAWRANRPGGDVHRRDRDRQEREAPPRAEPVHRLDRAPLAVDAVVVQRDHPVEDGDHLGAEGRGPLERREDHEVVAPDVPEERALPAVPRDRVAQDARGLEDDPVGLRVAVGVVVGLQAVEIDVRERERHLRVEPPLHLPVDRASAGEPRHRRRLERRLAAAEHRVDPGDELLRVERLRQVVVGAEPEPAHLVRGLAPRRQEDRAERIPRALIGEGLEEREPVAVGQLHVDEEDLGPPLVHDPARLGAGPRLVHVVPLAPQHLRADGADRRVVVHDERPRAGGAAAADEGLDRRGERVRRRGLREVVVRAAPERRVAAARRGEREERRAPGVRIVVEDVRERDAVERRHERVPEHDPRRGPARRGERALDVGRARAADAARAEDAAGERRRVRRVDDEHERRVGRDGRPLPDDLRRLLRHHEEEPGPAARLALGPDRAAVGLDDPARDREAEAGAAHALRPLAPGLLELLEDALEVGLRDPLPGVPDRHARDAGDRGVPEHAHLDDPVVGGELERVREEVREDLHEPPAVGDEAHRLAGHLDPELLPALRRGGLVAVHRGARELVEEDDLRLHAELALREAGDVEQLVHHRVQLLRRLARHPEVARLLLAELAGEPGEDEVERAGDRGERRPELVAHDLDELLLARVEVLQVGDVPERDRDAREPPVALEHGRHHRRERAPRDVDLLRDPGASRRIGVEPAHQVERVEAERVLEPRGAERPFGGSPQHPPRGGVREDLVRARRGVEEPVRHALDHPLEARALVRQPRRERAERLRHLVHEHVEDARVSLPERVRPRALHEHRPDADVADLDGEREPRRERLDERPLAGAQDPHPHRRLRQLGPRVLAVRGERVRLHGEERRLAEPGAGPDEEVGRGARRRDERGRDVARDDAREALDDPLEDPRVALRPAHLARDLRGRLERLEPPVHLGVEPGPLAAQLDLLERAEHGLPELPLLPGLHEVAPHLPAVDGVHDLARVGVGREEDGAELRIEPVRGLDELDPGHARHALVGDQEVHLPRLQELERERAVRRRQRLVAVLRREAAAEDREHLGLVVHEQDDVRHRESAPSPEPENPERPADGSTRVARAADGPGAPRRPVPPLALAVGGSKRL